MKYLLIRNLFPALLFLLATKSLDAQPAISTIDSFFTTYGPLALNGNILLATDGNVLYSKSFGWADTRTGKRNDEVSSFNLASISKIFTSTAILQLMERGKLVLDDPFRQYFPEFPYPQITIRHLLSHTSGLPDFELYESLVEQYPDTIIRNNTIIPALINWRKPLSFKPGDKWQYCNAGYELLALLVERVSKSPFPSYLEKFIFKPAGMTRTYVKDFGGRKEQHAPVTMHVLPVWYTNRYVAVDSVARFRYIHYNCGGTIGASNIITTTGDLLKFDQAFFGGLLLKEKTMAQAFTPATLNDGSIYKGPMDTMLGEGEGSYGLGWRIFQQPGIGKSVGHGGFKFGLATFYFRNLSTGQTIIAYDNTAGSEFGKVVTSALYLMNHRQALAMERKESLARIYGTTLAQQGANHAAAILVQLKSDTANYYLSEQQMNWLGYDLLYAADFEGHTLLSLEVFKINTLLFPNSFNTYDSYGEALWKSGYLPEASWMYKKSIRLNPANEGGQKALAEISSELKE